MPVTNAKWRIRNLVSTRHREWPMFQEPMLPIRSAPTTEVSLRDSDVAAADMQTIEDGPRGKELEPDNNPQAPVLQQPEPPNKANKWQHPGKSATTRAQSKLGNILPPPQFKLFGMQGASAMASRVGVSTILLRPGFSLWLSSWLEGPTMYQNGSRDCVWMDECRTSRSDANIFFFWR
jgi:hypothetical protein